MRFAKATLALALVLIGIMASGSALAHGGHHHHGHHHRSHVHFGFFVGAPAFWYYPPAYYYYPPVVAVPYSPPVYIERGDTRAAPEQSQGYWYYCPEARAYYPYVQQCAGGWQRVVPQPPPPGG